MPTLTTTRTHHTVGFLISNASLREAKASAVPTNTENLRSTNAFLDVVSHLMGMMLQGLSASSRFSERQQMTELQVLAER